DGVWAALADESRRDAVARAGRRRGPARRRPPPTPFTMARLASRSGRAQKRGKGSEDNGGRGSRCVGANDGACARTRHVKRSNLQILLIAILLAAAACSHRRRSGSMSEPPANVTLQVTNHNFLDVTVFVLTTASASAWDSRP